MVWGRVYIRSKISSCKLHTRYMDLRVKKMKPLFFYIYLLNVIIKGSDALTLTNDGREVKCVVRKEEEASKYCLALQPDQQQTLEGAEFECFLNDLLIYRCLEGVCSEHGALQGHTAAPDTPHYRSCPGVPVSRWHGDLEGDYFCRLQPSSSFPALNNTLHIQFCKNDEKFRLELWKDRERVDCLQNGTVEVDNYCLQVCSAGKVQFQETFKCFLNGTLVYTCSSTIDCRGEGALAGHQTVPKYVMPECGGINFANLYITATHLLGRYTCCASSYGCLYFDISPCTTTDQEEDIDESNRQQVTSQVSTLSPNDREYDDSQAKENKSILIPCIAVSVILPFVVAGVVYQRCRQKGRCQHRDPRGEARAGANMEDETVPLDDVQSHQA